VRSGYDMYYSSIRKNERRRMTMEKRYWNGEIDSKDDFGVTITKTFVDGATRHGPWAIMSPKSWKTHGVARLGTGFGQMYEKQSDGRWLKVSG
jgi:hypothetical protein